MGGILESLGNPWCTGFHLRPLGLAGISHLMGISLHIVVLAPFLGCCWAGAGRSCVATGNAPMHTTCKVRLNSAKDRVSVNTKWSFLWTQRHFSFRKRLSCCQSHGHFSLTTSSHSHHCQGQTAAVRQHPPWAAISFHIGWVT